jgi:hypothetical protein
MNVHYNSLGCVRAKEPCGAFRPGAMIRDMQVSTRPLTRVDLQGERLQSLADVLYYLVLESR